MAEKRRGSKGGGKKPAPRKKRASRKKTPLQKLWKKHSTDFLLGSIVAVLAFSVAFLMGGGCEEKQEAVLPAKTVTLVPKEKVKSTPVSTATPTPHPSVAATPTPVKPDTRPRIAIIIDDMGSSVRQVKELLAITEPLAFAVLPHLAHSEEVATKAFMAKRIVMLHQPMAATSRGAHPGPGVMKKGESRAQLLRTLARNLKSVPFVSGINNHMGSLFTTLPTEMKVVMREVKKRGFFFVDSRTTAQTVALTTARALNVPSAKRDIFLDNEESVSLIREQIMKLVKRAKKEGSAIAIGHPYRETIEALRTTLPRIKKEVRIVPITELLTP